MIGQPGRTRQAREGGMAGGAAGQGGRGCRGGCWGQSPTEALMSAGRWGDERGMASGSCSVIILAGELIASGIARRGK